MDSVPERGDNTRDFVMGAREGAREGMGGMGGPREPGGPFGRRGSQGGFRRAQEEAKKKGKEETKK
jgi:hypothetical protein